MTYKADYVHNAFRLCDIMSQNKPYITASNLSSMNITRNILHILSNKSDKRDSKNMVKSEVQVYCDSSRLEVDRKLVLRYSTYLAVTFQFLMTRGVNLRNDIEQSTTGDPYKTGTPEFIR